MGKKYVKYKDKHKTIDNIEYKLCPDCNKWFSMNEENFKVHSSKKDGFSDKCRSCQELYSHNRYMKNRDKEIERAKKYNNNIRDKQKHNKENLQAYHSNRWGYKDSHRESERKRRRNGKYNEWLNNTEGGLKSKKKTQEQQREKKHIIYDIEWENCKRYFYYKCAYCGLPIEEHYKKYRDELKQYDFHREHVIHKGKNDLSNCVPSCEVCNNEKYIKSLNEWYNKNNPKYDINKYLKIYNWLRWDYKKYIMPKRRYKGQHLSARLKEIESNKQNNK